jgi:S-adenosylmethionine synthetase
MKLYSNEVVFRGHPDKVCDQISGAILKACMEQDPKTRAGIECMIKNADVFVAGELTTKAKIDIEQIAKRVLKSIGYKETFKIHTYVQLQEPQIAMGVDTGGAGDQGMMFGYACAETPQHLPKAMVILQELARIYDTLVQNMRHLFHPDGKAQITGYYNEHFELVKIKTFTISYCNTETKREFTDNIIKSAVNAIAKKYGVDIEETLINPTGAFSVGGPFADAGLTGRKIVVDAYQSFANVGGGCMNGKDPTKVDFSGAHKAREIAVRYLKRYKLRWCEVQLSYAIGVAKPLAIYIDSDKGNYIADNNLYNDCKPKSMIKTLKLNEIDFENLATFGHFR